MKFLAYFFLIANLLLKLIKDRLLFLPNKFFSKSSIDYFYNCQKFFNNLF